MNELGENVDGTYLAVSGPRVVVRGGCIRFDPEGPKLHTNPMHVTVGIIPSSLVIDGSGHLNFNLDVSLPVVSAKADPDETLVGRGISAGISGGVGLCVVRFKLEGRDGYLNLNNADHYAKLEGSTSNLWITINSVTGRA